MTESNSTRYWNSNAFRLSVGTVVSVIVLYLAVRDVPLDDVWLSLARVNYAWTGVALAAILLGSWLRAWRWMRLYYPLDKGLRAHHMWGISWAGQMLNIVFPGRVGEIARIFLANEIEKRGKTQTIATLAVEKLFDTLMLLAILLAIPFFMSLPVWLEESRAGLIGTSLLLLLMAIGLALFSDRILIFVEKIPLAQRGHFLNGKIQLALNSLNVLKKWNVHLELQVLSILIWVLAGMTNYVTMLALNLALPLISGFLLLVVTQVGGLVPSSPGKVGFFQALCILTLSIFGEPQSVGLAYGILLYLVAFGPPLVIGVVYLWWQGINLRRLSVSQAESAQ